MEEATPNPVRIYVLHHPDSKTAARLTHRIYDWFRMPSLGGIPVYVRSAAAAGGTMPSMPAGREGEECLEYLVPLVDAHMVRDPVWHEYLHGVAERSDRKTADDRWGWVMLPVALDGTAFNLPSSVARRNFIRHGTAGAAGAAATATDPASPAARAQEQEKEQENAEETLKHLTEALARDLNSRLFPKQAAARFKVFISYARADGTDVPKALRTYVQSQTQCVVFFDENDIGFGQAFDETLADNVGAHARAMIVVNGDHYAERPWCRWEIYNFTKSRPIPTGAAKGQQGPDHVRFFLPVLVVDTMNGPKMTRVVPELALAPTVRWMPGRERACFSALMREVVFGLRDLLVAQSMRSAPPPPCVVVNRLPGPVALAGLIGGGGAKEFTVHHPGHGLPQTELLLLRRMFPNVAFSAFRDINRLLPAAMEQALLATARNPGARAPLREQVIAISTAYHESDLASLGYLPQHQDETLIHLLRPLLRLGADLLYGGAPAKRDMQPAQAQGNLSTRNITLTLLQLMSDERQVPDDPMVGSAAAPAPGAVLFNISAWPRCQGITADDEAAWINSCRIHRVMPADAHLPDWPGALPADNEFPPQFRRYLALTLSRLRELLAEGFACPVPGNLARRVKPAAFVLVGGAVEQFAGVMPGVMEELLRAARARPAIPIYLMGGLGGATRVLARTLLDKADAQRPAELTVKHYVGRKGQDQYGALWKELSEEERTRVRGQFDDLWSLIRERRRAGRLDDLFGNGLDDADNRTLLTTTSTTDAVALIWKGMSRVLLPGHAGKAEPAARAPARRPRGR